MKKVTIPIIVLLVIFVYGCSNAPTPTAAPKPTETPGAALYRVTKDTGLYWSVTSNEPDGVLQVGTLLKPANNEKYFHCENVVDTGTTFRLCQIEVVSTGKTGWVLSKWMETYKP